MSVKDTPRNLYLHEVLDVWFEHEVKPRLRGRAFEVRYAEDAVRVFEHEEDARRVRAVLARRMEKYGLRLHPDKTRRVDARRPDKRPRGGTRRGRSFTTLGFTHYWGRSGKGRWVVKRKTAKACGGNGTSGAFLDTAMGGEAQDRQGLPPACCLPGQAPSA